MEEKPKDARELQEWIENIETGIKELADYIQNIPVGAYKEYEETTKKAIKFDEKLQKKQLQILEIFRKTHLDLFGEGTIDWLFAQINNNPGLMKQFGFKTKIDIENGILGTETSPNPLQIGEVRPKTQLQKYDKFNSFCTTDLYRNMNNLQKNNKKFDLCKLNTYNT